MKNEFTHILSNRHATIGTGYSTATTRVSSKVAIPVERL
jgi:hypothetical protein